MGRKVIDRVGTRFGKLEVLKFIEKKGKESFWLCRCDCGTLVTMRASNLRNVRSCGCARSEAQEAAWIRRREEAARARLEERMKVDAERRHEEFLERQMIRNQEAGMRFDDFWMFDGKDPKGWWERITV